jgi:soluble lytic murein transglycosylase-like protein
MYRYGCAWSRFVLGSRFVSAFPLKMSTRSITVAIALAGLWLSSATATRAQIASYVDEHGKVIYTNDSPSPRRTAVKPRAHLDGPALTVTPPDSTAVSVASLGLISSNGTESGLDQIVREASERHNLDPALVKAVIGTESGWNPKAVSNKGALGLMQLIPSTAGRMGVSNAFDPAQNVDGGARYLRSLLDRYHGDLEMSLAAYNAGEGAVERFGGVPAYPETRAYVKKVTNSYFRPGSGRDPKLWEPRRPPVRQTVTPDGRVIFTNE